MKHQVKKFNLLCYIDPAIMRIITAEVIFMLLTAMLWKLSPILLIPFGVVTVLGYGFGINFLYGWRNFNLARNGFLALIVPACCPSLALSWSFSVLGLSLIRVGLEAATKNGQPFHFTLELPIWPSIALFMAYIIGSAIIGAMSHQKYLSRRR